MRVAVLATLLVIALMARTAGAQSAQPSRWAFPIGLQLGFPQGEFAENVNLAGGLGGGVLVELAPMLALRAELGFQIYGSESRRIPLGGGGLGLAVDVTTTNGIASGGIGAQLGMPGRGVRPYIGGLVGFSNFTTTSAIEGLNSSDEEFSRSTNSSDNAFAKTALAGLYIPMGSGTVQWDIGVRHTWNGESVRYLTRGDIVEDAGGNIIITQRESRADLLTVSIGITIRPGLGR